MVTPGAKRDAVAHAFGCGRRFRILCVMDDFTRECLALVPDTYPSGESFDYPHL